VKEDSELTQSTHANDSLTVQYIEVMQKSFATSHLKQQIQTPVATPTQGSAGQSGPQSGPSTSQTKKEK
jgi:hypothetical protein